MPDEVLEAYRKAVKDCADGALIGDERRHHLEPYVARFERAVEAHTDRSTTAGILPPAVLSKKSVTAEGLQSQASSQLSGESKSVGKVGIGWLKHTIRQYAARSRGGVWARTCHHFGVCQS